MNTLSKGRIPVADDINRREAAGAYVSAGRRLDDKKCCEVAGASRPLTTGFRGCRVDAQDLVGYITRDAPFRATAESGALHQARGLYSSLRLVTKWMRERFRSWNRGKQPSTGREQRTLC